MNFQYFLGRQNFIQYFFLNSKIDFMFCVLYGLYFIIGEPIQNTLFFFQPDLFLALTSYERPKMFGFSVSFLSWEDLLGVIERL